jgi:hypothetical protein
LFLSTKSFTPGPLKHFPRLKTSRISSLFFKCSFRLNRKETISPLIGLFLVRNTQFSPALSSAALEDQPSAPGFHPGPEPEFTVPLHFTWLISPFHGIFSCLYKGSCEQFSESSIVKRELKVNMISVTP